MGIRITARTIEGQTFDTTVESLTDVTGEFVSEWSADIAGEIDVVTAPGWKFDPGFGVWEREA